MCRVRWQWCRFSRKAPLDLSRNDTAWSEEGGQGLMTLAGEGCRQRRRRGLSLFKFQRARGWTPWCPSTTSLISVAAEERNNEAINKPRDLSGEFKNRTLLQRLSLSASSRLHFICTREFSSRGLPLLLLSLQEREETVCINVITAFRSVACLESIYIMFYRFLFQLLPVTLTEGARPSFFPPPPFPPSSSHGSPEKALEATSNCHPHRISRIEKEKMAARSELRSLRRLRLTRGHF